jgi:RNA polymerase sigma-70 factor, ECF subfamily
MQKGLYQYCYKEMMKLCCRYTNDVETSASIYNDAMIKVFSNIGTYKEDGKLMAWVKRIVVNTCIDHVRKKTPLQMKELNENDNNAAIIENDVFIKMSNAEIKRLISQLPQNAGLVFNLYVYEEYNHNEIAELLKIPSGTSRYYLSEARRLLKEVMANNIYSLNKV